VAAAGAPGAVGARLATEAAPMCKAVGELIGDLRSDLYLAVRLSEFVKVLNERIKVDAEERGIEAVEVSEKDVKECLKYRDDVKVVDSKGVEVLWLWDGWRMYDLISRIAEVAVEEKEVLASP
jgi:hypothetical protein